MSKLIKKYGSEVFMHLSNLLYLVLIIIVSLLNPGWIGLINCADQKLWEEHPKTVFDKNSQTRELLIGGILDRTALKIGFVNNGRFCPPAEFRSDLPNAIYFEGKRGALELLDLWIGVPDGPWAPKVWNADSQRYESLGPTVSGTIFEPQITGTDWSTIIGTQNVLYSSEVLYSDIYPPSRVFDFILAPTSHLEQTWGRDPLTGFRKWPGRWRKDPVTGKIMEGAFFGSQDILISFDDKSLADQFYPTQIGQDYPLFSPQRGYAIGAEVLAQAVGFQEGVLSNLVIFDLLIINTSNWDYDGVYVGIYYKTMLNYGVKTQFIKNEYSAESNHMIPYNLSYSSPSKYVGKPYQKWFAVQLLKTPIADNDQLDNDGDGQMDEPREELGLTGWHFLNEHTFDNFPMRERLQYQLLAGDTTGMRTILDRYCFFSDSTGHLDVNFDSPEALAALHIRIKDSPNTIISQRVDWTQHVLSCGPIHWAPRDTIRFVFAILVSDDLEQLEALARKAREIIEIDYNFDLAPKPPVVHAVAQDGKVTLYWDRSAETSVDFATGYQDFEGYKIYRTTSDPANNQWGQPNYDDQGNFVNFIPIARCDLNNGIKGYETIYPHQYLGNDTSLFHTWTDTSVTNGVTYWYSVCSYDHGILTDEKWNPLGYKASPLKECAKGTNPERHLNLVKVIPGTMATNMSPPTVRVEPLANNVGNGPIEAIIIDPYIISDHNYLMSFEDTTFKYAVYDLYDETSGKLLFEKVKQTNGEEGIIFDGLQLFVQRYDNLDVLDEKCYWYKFGTNEPSPCTWKIYGGKLTLDPHPFEYEIRFIDHFESGIITGKTGPFEVWNTVLNKKCAWDIFYNSLSDTSDSLKNTWSSGDIIYVWDDFGGNHPYTLRIIITEYYYYTYQGRVNIPPQPGDVAHIVLKRPFRTGDKFRIITTAMKAHSLSNNQSNYIKVVPNPFIVQAGWELNRDEAKIQFIHLPSICKIHIFTLAGEKVITLDHNDPNTDYEFWDLLNSSNLKVSYGMYLFVVEDPNGAIEKGKFVILR